MNLVKGISSIVGLGLTATAVGVGIHLSSSSSDSTVSGKLSSKKDRFLNFDYSKDEKFLNADEKNMAIGSYSAWLAVASSYSVENDASKKFLDLSFTFDNSERGNNAKNQESIKELKKRCAGLLRLEGNQKNIDLFERWCIKPSYL